jgi:hypothetical protein
MQILIKIVLTFGVARWHLCCLDPFYQYRYVFIRVIHKSNPSGSIALPCLAMPIKARDTDLWTLNQLTPDRRSLVAHAATPTLIAMVGSMG